MLSTTRVISSTLSKKSRLFNLHWMHCKDGNFNFEIILEVMGSFHEMPSECDDFSRSKKMYWFVSTLLAAGTLGAFRKHKVFQEHIWCGKKRPNKKFRLLYEWVEDEIDARKSILVSEVREHAGLLLGEKL